MSHEKHNKRLLKIIENRSPSLKKENKKSLSEIYEGFKLSEKSSCSFMGQKHRFRARKKAYKKLTGKTSLMANPSLENVKAHRAVLTFEQPKPLNPIPKGYVAKKYTGN